MAKTVRICQIQEASEELFGVRLKRLEEHVSAIHKSALTKISELDKRISELDGLKAITAFDILEDKK